VDFVKKKTKRCKGLLNFWPGFEPVPVQIYGNFTSFVKIFFSNNTALVTRPLKSPYKKDPGKKIGL
jgi:hypothetical protein